MKIKKLYEFQDINLDQASKLIGKDLNDVNIKTVIKEISDFIENNIHNKDLNKEIDELIDINKNLKNKI